MRQLASFLEKIRIRTTTEEYYRMKFMADLKGAQITPLDAILGIPLDEESMFDSKTDTELEKRALQMLEERRAMSRG